MSGRAVVIGAGVVGLCAADALLDDGWQVTIVDRPPASGPNCSHGNGGMIVPSHFTPLASPGMVRYGLGMMLRRKSPFGLRLSMRGEALRWLLRFVRHCTPEHVARVEELIRDLNLASKALYDRYEELFAGRFDIHREGMLMLCRTPARLRSEIAHGQRAKALGLQAESLSPEQLSAREPAMRFDVVGGVLLGDDAHFDAATFMRLLSDRVLERGAEWRHDDALALVPGEGRIVSVRTRSENLSADAVVIASGAMAGNILRSVGVGLPLMAGKGYSFTVPSDGHRMRACAILTESRVAVTPLGEQVRFSGTMELGPPDSRVNPRRVAGILESIPRYLPGFARLDVPMERVWMGLRPLSPDGLPYLGVMERFGNLAVATGHAMMGMSLGPITGRIVADLLASRDPGFDLSPCRPERFTAGSR